MIIIIVPRESVGGYTDPESGQEYDLIGVEESVRIAKPDSIQTAVADSVDDYVTAQGWTKNEL